MPKTADDTRADHVAYLARLGDDQLILGHRLSEWCGHAPMLEEDLALANMGLDLIGQARALYTRAGEVEGRGRDEDAFAYLRRENEYQNLLIVERPNGDFAHTMLRQFYYALFMEGYWRAAASSADETLAAIAVRALKEMTYHVRHAGEWVVRLGDGTEESSRRTAAAVEALHPYTGEMFQTDALTRRMIDAGIAPDPEALKAGWNADVARVFAEAKLPLPKGGPMLSGGREGRHTEHLGHLLAELQYMQRSYPGATW